MDTIAVGLITKLRAIKSSLQLYVRKYHGD